MDIVHRFTIKMNEVHLHERSYFLLADRMNKISVQIHDAVYSIIENGDPVPEITFEREITDLTKP